MLSSIRIDNVSETALTKGRVNEMIEGFETDVLLDSVVVVDTDRALDDYIYFDQLFIYNRTVEFMHLCIKINNKIFNSKSL